MSASLAQGTPVDGRLFWTRYAEPILRDDFTAWILDALAKLYASKGSMSVNQSLYPLQTCNLHPCQFNGMESSTKPWKTPQG
ncbi:hypothetical protein NEUTE1DRAFT_123030 [Neurospora tetrasperma FGSC 2508]|uniref:Uncharacterized protein n=1 Tax=Neurospora tetrasperma (strain FGSC 2508 / ATCC MYA-4615 / P0657) TaxID=510951 RepID=F8MQ77_NEUT8|nr:uncharacterized protein NEUTE1DRAFT_123030 [Neurospora tetrasperma FGSC 2508]EGO56507.1 hypothetical protein NEUTE1DRAFT_123030 [Neurospora tetrasperma FGSC 2508]